MTSKIDYVAETGAKNRGPRGGARAVDLGGAKRLSRGPKF